MLSNAKRLSRPSVNQRGNDPSRDFPDSFSILWKTWNKFVGHSLAVGEVFALSVCVIYHVLIYGIRFRELYLYCLLLFFFTVLWRKPRRALSQRSFHVIRLADCAESVTTSWFNSSIWRIALECTGIPRESGKIMRFLVFFLETCRSSSYIGILKLVNARTCRAFEVVTGLFQGF